MRYLLIISLLSLTFSQELKVEGDLNVTGSMQSTTIDSLKQVIQQLEAQIASMQGGNKLETRVFETGIISTGDTLDLFNDLNIPDILSNSEFYLLRIIDVQDLNVGGGDYLIKLQQVGQNSTMSSILCGVDNCFVPFEGSGTNHQSIEGIFSSELLLINIANSWSNLSGRFTLAITAQFPSEFTVQQNLNKPQTEEIK